MYILQVVQDPVLLPWHAHAHDEHVRPVGVDALQELPILLAPRVCVEEAVGRATGLSVRLACLGRPV